MQKLTFALILGVLLSGLAGAPGPLTVAHASVLPSIDVTNDEVALQFPESATFHATITGDAEIASVVLEYGNEQQTCGTVIAKSFPQFTSGKTVEVEWTWEMRQSGSLPPGAQLWWRWHITDTGGAETVTDTRTATWLDDVHPWQTMSEGDTLRLHWYEGDQTFATELAQAAAAGLKFNETQSGLKADAPIDIYIYANTDDLQEAVLYEPSWTGGQAYPEQNIVILGIAEYELDWGKDTIVHELTHVLVGHLTFSCLGDVPTWLNEGLAVYSEGGLDPASQQQLDDAIRNDTLLTVRSLSSGFSEVADKAYLSYSQSYSITKFLVETYGQDKMTALLVALRDGLTIEEALRQTYGFDVDGLEDAWRASIGAQPRPTPPGGVSAQPTAQPAPTFVPTIIPFGGTSFGGQQQPQPTATPPAARQTPPLALTLLLLSVCCFLTLIVGILILGLVLRNQNKGGTNAQ